MGQLSHVNDRTSNIKILRETRVPQSLVLKCQILKEINLATDKQINIRDRRWTRDNTDPPNRYQIEMDLRNTLPIEGVDILMGNNLAGSKYIVL